MFETLNLDLLYYITFQKNKHLDGQHFDVTSIRMKIIFLFSELGD